MSVEHPIYGRSDDLAFLHDRINSPGITVVAAKPKMGKTRLLEELRDQLNDKPAYLCGYVQATQATHDVMKSALADLYKLWLERASYKKQATQVIEHIKEHWAAHLGLSAKVLGKALDVKCGNTGIIDAAVSGLFGQLISLNDHLKTGGIEDPPLTRDQVRSVLKCVREKESNYPILILDAFEQSSEIQIARAGGDLDHYLEHIDDWPACHFVLAVRCPPAGDKKGELRGYDRAKGWEKAHGKGKVRIHQLDSMKLSDVERVAIRQDIREAVPGDKSWFDNIEDESFFACLDGFPGTYRRWLDDKPASVQELESIELEAREYRNSRLVAALENLVDQDTDHLPVAVRLSLSPEMTKESWGKLGPVIMKEASDRVLADLCARGILKQPNPPSFGHAKEHEVARYLMIKRPEDGEQKPLFSYAQMYTREMIDDCARSVQAISPAYAVYAEQLFAIGGLGETLELEDDCLGLCVAAGSLLGMKITAYAPRWRQRFLASAKKAHADRELCCLIASGLTNASFNSRGEEMAGYLQELRDLYGSNREDAAVREPFAKGLFNAFNGSQDQEAAGYLRELRDLYGSNREDAAVREQFAKGLTNAIAESSGEEMAGYLQELRDLYGSNREDAAVRERFAKGLFNAFNRSQDQEAAGYLQELRDLYHLHSEDAEMVAIWVLLLCVRGLRIFEKDREAAMGIWGEVKEVIARSEALIKESRHYDMVSEAIRDLSSSLGL